MVLDSVIESVGLLCWGGAGVGNNEIAYERTQRVLLFHVPTSEESSDGGLLRIRPVAGVRKSVPKHGREVTVTTSQSLRRRKAVTGVVLSSMGSEAADDTVNGSKALTAGTVDKLAGRTREERVDVSVGGRTARWVEVRMVRDVGGG